MKIIYLKNEKGVATLIALIMIGMLTLIGLAALSTSEDEVSIAGNELQEMRAFYAADAGLEAALAVMQDHYDTTGGPPSVMPSWSGTLNHCKVVYQTTLSDSSQPKVIGYGAMEGLHADYTSFKVQSTATSTADNASVMLEQSYAVATVPVFQFAVFYNDDLEIAPLGAMNIGGRVHTNRNLYMGPDSDLKMARYVTAGNRIWAHHKAWAGGGSGDILIKDDNDTYISMQKDGGWLDAGHADWHDSSVARWANRVQDQAHRAPQLYVPQDGTNDPRRMIEPGTGNPLSYEHQASLTIIDGTVMRFMEDNTWQDVTAAMIADSVISLTTNTFYDQRESEWVDATELDIGKMYDSGYAPRNGVIYFYDKIHGASNWPAFRLTDASELDTGLTIASENPLYTMGDFNSIVKQPASLIADAITLLSGNWVDSISTEPTGSRDASNTTVNACLLTGNTETTPGVYNGGLENLPRLLEDWAGRTLTWTGSAVNLWYSQQATGNWSTAYYTEPNRAWQYDADLDVPANHPPQAPRVRFFLRLGWKQHDIFYNWAS